MSRAVSQFMGRIRWRILELPAIGYRCSSASSRFTNWRSATNERYVRRPQRTRGTSASRSRWCHPTLSTAKTPESYSGVTTLCQRLSQAGYKIFHHQDVQRQALKLVVRVQRERIRPRWAQLRKSPARELTPPASMTVPMNSATRQLRSGPVLLVCLLECCVQSLSVT